MITKLPINCGEYIIALYDTVDNITEGEMYLVDDVWMCPVMHKVFVGVWNDLGQWSAITFELFLGKDLTK